MDSVAAARDYYGRKGIGIMLVEAENLNKVKISAEHVEFFAAGEDVMLNFGDDVSLPENLRHLKFTKDTIVVAHHNAYVNTGLNNALDLEFGLGGTAVSKIGVSSNTTAVTASTVNLNGASGGTAANTIIKAATNSRSSQTVTSTVTSAFVNADFTSGVFVWNKIGLLNTATDAGTGLIDVIGGTGGSSPYNRTFSLDLTSAGTFSVTAAIAVTATAV